MQDSVVQFDTGCLCAISSGLGQNKVFLLDSDGSIPTPISVVDDGIEGLIHPLPKQDGRCCPVGKEKGREPMRTKLLLLLLLYSIYIPPFSEFPASLPSRQ